MTFPSAEEKRVFTRDLFNRLARRYELVNQVMSMGQVNGWRRLAARATALPGGGHVLDVGAGNGGLSAALRRAQPTARITAIDLTPAMVRMGHGETAGQGIAWAEGDALHLPFPEATFDAAINGFMLRNVTDVRAALAEHVRVVRPGGRVVCLEMTWPRSPLFRPLFHLYFGGVVPLLGWLLTGYREAYLYLPHSVQVFMSPEDLATTMEAAGLRNVQYRLLMMGTVTLHVGER